MTLLGRKGKEESGLSIISEGFLSKVVEKGSSLELIDSDVKNLNKLISPLRDKLRRLRVESDNGVFSIGVTNDVFLLEFETGGVSKQVVALSNGKLHEETSYMGAKKLKTDMYRVWLNFTKIFPLLRQDACSFTLKFTLLDSKAASISYIPTNGKTVFELDLTDPTIKSRDTKVAGGQKQESIEPLSADNVSTFNELFKNLSMLLSRTQFRANIFAITSLDGRFHLKIVKDDNFKTFKQTLTEGKSQKTLISVGSDGSRKRQMMDVNEVLAESLCNEFYNVLNLINSIGFQGNTFYFRAKTLTKGCIMTNDEGLKALILR